MRYSEKQLRAMTCALPPLSVSQEYALRTIKTSGEGLFGTLPANDLHKLLVLQLIEWDGRSWRLTDKGVHAEQLLASNCRQYKTGNE